jgi:hypothetical protein
MTRQTLRTAVAASLAALLAWGGTLSVPVDPEQAKQFETAAKSAAAEGNWSAALREYRRLIEVYPNEPGLQAPIYFAMAEAADKSGDAAQSQVYTAMSRALDPTLDARIAQAQKSSAAATTRGNPNGGSKADYALGVLSAALGSIAQVRQQRQQQNQMMQQQQMMPQQQQQQYAYPQAPYGQPGYQPPPNNAYQPMPGYQDPNAAAMQQQQMQANPYAAPPQPGQYTPPPGYQPQQQAQMPQQQMNPYAAAQPQQAAGYYPPPPADPYRPPQGYQPQGMWTRGESAAPIKVVHDHSRNGDKAYFATGCGALIVVNGGNLTFTPGGGEAPRVIPASEIAEIRLNTAVGKDAGAFHIVTKKGLYIHLAPATGAADDARTIVDALRKQLSL